MSLFELITKVELLLHFASTVVKHAKDLKDQLKDASDEEVLQEAGGGVQEEDSEEDCQQVQHVDKKRKTDC